MSTSAPPARSTLRRRLPRPQFSLRFLLLAVTAFAIGFPIWYRWPIEEVQLTYPKFSMQLGSKSFQVEDKRAPIKRTVTTWRRSWGKGKVKHGPKKDYRPDGEQLIITHYQNDQRHGPYLYTAKGELRESGQYEHDRKEGKWTTYIPRVGMRATVDWHENQIHGQAEIQFSDGAVDRLKLDGGLVTHANDQPVSSPLLDRIRRGEIQEPHVVEELQGGMSTLFGNSLRGWMSWTTDVQMVNVPLLVSPAVTDLEVPFDARIVGINFQSGLVVVTQRNGLDCDYRYGCLWITTPADTEDWHDPTGVAELRLMPRSPLTAAWNEPIQAWRFDEPLATALGKLFAPLGIDIDTTRIAPTSDNPDRFRINLHLTINGHYFPLRHLLGLLLYKTRCRCRLDGDKLVILPPEDESRDK